MENVFFEGTVMWAHVDANRHMRHSAYADFGAQARLVMLEKVNMPPQIFEKLQIGPILFREESVYLREVNMSDFISVTCELVKSKKDASRWTVRHNIYRSDGIKAAIITVDGAWLNMNKRKLTALDANFAEQFNEIPLSEDFEWIE